MDIDGDDINRELRRIEHRVANRQYRDRIVEQHGRDELRRRVRVQVSIHRKRKQGA